MRFVAVFAILSSALPLCAAEKLTFDERVELMRGLMAEYGKAKILVPRSKKNLEINAADSSYDKSLWQSVAKEYGPAARVGDLIQITKVDIESDKIVLQLNKGFRGGRHWFDGVQVGMGPTNNPSSVPIGAGDSNAPGGTTIEVMFHKPLEPMKAAAVKKILAPILDFDPHTATEIFSETLTPATKKAIQEKRAVVGMTRDQVLLALERPKHKSREVTDGVETEDWVYGTAPGKITFVTFNGDKVIKVKESYAGLGTDVGQDVIR